MNTIKAIETRYAGCRFRSRLEARWAVFFDKLGIQWQYEPEGYDLFSGRYLPDFLLPDVNQRGVWFEVKPDESQGDDPRWNELALVTGKPVFVAIGMARPDSDIIWGDTRNGHIQLYDVGWDNGHAFCICGTCDRVGIQFEGRHQRICRHVSDDHLTNYDDPRILEAYTAARSARFEHGEQG